jgi:branched-chain amino acid transport system permease protein
LTYRLIIKHTIGKSAMSALLATFGLSMVLKNVCLNRFSPNFRLLSDTWLTGKVLTLYGLIWCRCPSWSPDCSPWWWWAACTC